MRVTVDQAGTVIQKDDYYPFGMTFQSWQANPPKNLYGFQGQEYQEETQWHQYKWRNADPALGRFFNVDPLAEEFYYNSTYAFSENKVTGHIELEGLESVEITSRFNDFQKIKSKKDEQIVWERQKAQGRGALLGTSALVASATFGAAILSEVTSFIAAPISYLKLAASNPSTVETTVELATDLLVPDGAPLIPSSGLDDIGKKLNSAVGDWASLQRAIAPSKRKLSKFNTASVVYDATTDSYFYGMNRGISISGDAIHPTLLKNLPEKSLNEFKLGNCAECDAVNQALHGGASWEDLILHTIGVNQDGTTFLKAQCTNCVQTFDGMKSTSEK
ncbi:MAG: RHS repeat-associated core domain-containing protein [Microcoleaceae cyanobacterium]